jgi:hypothetical protein
VLCCCDGKVCSGEACTGLEKVPEKTLRKVVPECTGAVMSQGRLIRRSRQTPTDASDVESSGAGGSESE